MSWVETNKESPTDTPVKDLEMIKLDYELIEFASNAAEELKKKVKKTQNSCAEFCRRVLLTYNQCQNSAWKILEVFPEHEMFLKHLQDRFSEDEQAI